MKDVRFSSISQVSEEVAPDTPPYQHQTEHHLPQPAAPVPRVVKTSLISKLLDLGIDLFLAACCVGFLIFAALARASDNARIAERRDFYDGLLQASQYICISQFS